MTDTIKLDFQPSDFEDTDFYSNTRCACALAFLRQFPTTNNIDAGGWDITADGQVYRFGAVVLNDDVIDPHGFGMMSFETIRRAFEADANTRAHIIISSR